MTTDQRIAAKALCRSQSCPHFKLQNSPPSGLKLPDKAPVRRHVEPARSTHDDNVKTEQSSSITKKYELPENLVLPPAPNPAFEHLRFSEDLHKRRSLYHNVMSSYSLPVSPFRRGPTADDGTSDKTYILRVCHALMSYGAPTHRLEQYMQSSAKALGISLESFYLPGCMIVSFLESSAKPSEVHIVRCAEALELTKLHEIHAIYKSVIHKRLHSDKAICQLEEISSRPDRCSKWLRVLLYGLTSLCFGPISYGARPIDLPIIFLLGSLVGWLQLVVAPRSELYGYVFEITAAVLVSCIGRAFGTITWGSDSGFCFSAISQASIVLLLPGFTITTSALELQSKNIVSGAVRMVYAIIYTLFLSFGFTVGTTIYGAIDSNATSAPTCSGKWPFWWQIAFVLPFTVCFALLNGGTWRKMPPMIIVTAAGWVVNYFSAQRFQSNLQISQALAAVTVGLLANLYSRLGHGLAMAVMHPAIYIQVPGSFAASGSFTSGLATADQVNSPVQNSSSVVSSNGTTQSTRDTSPILDAGFTMVQLAISITVGLSISALLVYPVRRSSTTSGIFSL